MALNKINLQQTNYLEVYLKMIKKINKSLTSNKKVNKILFKIKLNNKTF